VTPVTEGEGNSLCIRECHYNPFQAAVDGAVQLDRITDRDEAMCLVKEPNELRTARGWVDLSLELRIPMFRPVYGSGNPELSWDG
jgi:hypothetical protein